jgi:hypothetical protein
MIRTGAADQRETLSDDAGAIPASLKAEYEELFLKRELLRAELERAKAELAGLRANGKATAGRA